MGTGTGTALGPAMAAAASSTAHRPRPLPAAATANRSASRPTASAPPGRTLVCSAPRQSRPPRRAVATTARAAEAGAPSSTSPDAVTYSSSIDTDMPLYEPLGVSFDEYLQDRPRVFRAMFPDESRSQQLSDEEWRIQMLPLEFLLITVRPVVVMQLRNRNAGGLDLRIVRIQPSNSIYIRTTASLQCAALVWAVNADRVGAEGAGQRLHAGELRPGRAGVALRGQGTAARQPAEGPPGDLHHRRPPAAPAHRARGHPPGRRRVGPVDACREDEAGRGRRPRRRLPEVPAGEGGVQSGGGESGQQSLKARSCFLVGDSFQGLFLQDPVMLRAIHTYAFPCIEFDSKY
uniref:Uncharacterized protein n=1 Tax=Aegilops tauschii subsp. strangulata TaxID=200361 RepID=A0A453B0F0_AEGTS